MAICCRRKTLAKQSTKERPSPSLYEYLATERLRKLERETMRKYRAAHSDYYREFQAQPKKPGRTKSPESRS